MQKGVRGSVRSLAGRGVWLVAAMLVVAGAAFGQNPNTPPPSGFPVGPRAQVLSFTADSTSIQPGQSVTLTWAAVNADRITIDPGIGIVMTRGSHTVTPTRTTTYTISAIGRGGADKKSLTVTVAGTTAAPETQQASEESQ